MKKASAVLLICVLSVALAQSEAGLEQCVTSGGGNNLRRSCVSAWITSAEGGSMWSETQLDDLETCVSGNPTTCVLNWIDANDPVVNPPTGDVDLTPVLARLDIIVFASEIAAGCAFGLFVYTLARGR